MKRIDFLRFFSILLVLIITGAAVACTTPGETEIEEDSSSDESSAIESDESQETSDVTSDEDEIDLPETNLELGDEIEYASAFTVSQVFSSNMVVQRDECVRVWGWADESENGKKVSATFMGYKADALIENGESCI